MIDKTQDLNDKYWYALGKAGFDFDGRRKWIPGMLDMNGYRLIRVTLHDGSWLAVSKYGLNEYYHPDPPDLRDPATKGCILQLLREHWDVGPGRTYAYVEVSPPVVPTMGEPWDIVVCDHHGEYAFIFSDSTEERAMAKALIAARFVKDGKLDRESFDAYIAAHFPADPSGIF